MKRKLSYSLLAVFAAAGFAAAEPVYTTPVGYVTNELTPGFNFIGLTIHNPIIATGAFDSQSATSLTDSNANFAFDPASNYVVEMTETSDAYGIIIDVPGSAFTSNSISGLVDINSSYLGGYQIREAAAIGDIFGNGPSCILQKGSPTAADLVYVPDGLDGFDIYYHTADVTVPIPIPGKWQKVGAGSADQSGAPLNYLDAFYVQIRNNPVELTVTGEVKVKQTSLPATSGFSYFASIYPAGSTLGTSNLAESVLKGSPTTADLIYMPDGLGGFDIFYHTADVTVPIPIPGKWQKVGAGTTDQSATPFSSGFIFQRKGADANLPFSVPASYTSN